MRLAFDNELTHQQVEIRGYRQNAVLGERLFVDAFVHVLVRFKEVNTKRVRKRRRRRARR